MVMCTSPEGLPLTRTGKSRVSMSAARVWAPAPARTARDAAVTHRLSTTRPSREPTLILPAPLLLAKVLLRGDEHPPTCDAGVLVLADHQRHLRSEEHTSELQSHLNLVCRLLLEKKKTPLKPSSDSASICTPI